MKYVFDSEDIEYLKDLIYHYGDSMFDVCSYGTFDDNSMNKSIEIRHIIFQFLYDHMGV